MGNVVNLNKFRKAKAKAEASKLAGANRHLQGRSKADRERDSRQKQMIDTKLDNSRIEPAADETDDDDSEPKP